MFKSFAAAVALFAFAAQATETDQVRSTYPSSTSSYGYSASKSSYPSTKPSYYDDDDYELSSYRAPSKTSSTAYRSSPTAYRSSSPYNKSTTAADSYKRASYPSSSYQTKTAS